MTSWCSREREQRPYSSEWTQNANTTTVQTNKYPRPEWGNKQPWSLLVSCCHVREGELNLSFRHSLGRTKADRSSSRACCPRQDIHPPIHHHHLCTSLRWLTIFPRPTLDGCAMAQMEATLTLASEHPWTVKKRWVGNDSAFFNRYNGTRK